MIKRFFSNWQGFTALIVSGLIFWLSPGLLRWLDPTAGVFDIGYLQRPIVAACYLLFGTFIAFTAIWIDFPTVDTWIDRKLFRESWSVLKERDQILFAGILFLSLLGAYLVCLIAVPV